MKKHWLILTLAALALTSCHDDNNNGGNEVIPNLPDYYYTGGQLGTTSNVTASAYEQETEAINKQGLMVASFGESNPQITQLMPVLSSPLLSIHVAVIMIAYSLLAFLMLGGIMAVVLRKEEAVVERLHIVGQIILYPAVFLLTIGVFIGAVWANVSWGTYWSWDPKEVWALITLIIYALPLHGRSLPAFGKPMFFHGYCIVAFLSVLVTYFGVNFVLGGMHSYA